MRIRPRPRARRGPRRTAQQGRDTHLPLPLRLRATQQTAHTGGGDCSVAAYLKGSAHGTHHHSTTSASRAIASHLADSVHSQVPGSATTRDSGRYGRAGRWTRARPPRRPPGSTNATGDVPTLPPARPR
eukprot:421186-Prymnesium_polylepis.1